MPVGVPPNLQPTTADGAVAVRSAMALAMGARISIVGPARGMYLIVGRSGPLEPAVRAAGGEVALRLNGHRMLAALPFAGYMSLRGSHQVSHIGPVTIDFQRLAAVAGQLARTAGQASGGGA